MHASSSCLGRNPQFVSFIFWHSAYGQGTNFVLSYPQDPDIKQISCVKGAYMVSEAPEISGAAFHCRAVKVTAIFIWEDKQWKHG